MIQECWRHKATHRPDFTSIVKRLQGDIRDEIRRKPEPDITMYSLERDEVYHERIGKTEELVDSDEEGGGDTEKPGGKAGVISKAEHERLLRKVMDELAAEREKARVAAEKLLASEKEVLRLSPEKQKKKEEDAKVQREMTNMLALMGR